MHAHRDLAVGPLAQSAAVLARDRHRHLPVLGDDTSSTAQASAATWGTIRCEIRRRTGTGSHVDWSTNCCRFCSLPSGSRYAIGWIDLRRPSSTSARR